MKILAFDTSAAACSVALRDGGQTIARIFEPMARGQAEALVPMIGDVLAAAGLAATDMDALAVTVGPGAFTGLRIGLATARGMALAANKPIRGITTLECLAAGAGPDQGHHPILAVMDTKRGDYYIQLFNATGKALNDPQALSCDEILRLPGLSGGVVLAGDGATALEGPLRGAKIECRIADASPLPDAAVLAALAATPGRTYFLPPDPLYIRPPEAKTAKSGGKLRP